MYFTSKVEGDAENDGKIPAILTGADESRVTYTVQKGGAENVDFDLAKLAGENDKGDQERN